MWNQACGSAGQQSQHARFLMADHVEPVWCYVGEAVLRPKWISYPGSECTTVGAARIRRLLESTIWINPVF